MKSIAIVIAAVMLLSIGFASAQPAIVPIPPIETPAWNPSGIVIDPTPIPFGADQIPDPIVIFPSPPIEPSVWDPFVIDPTTLDILAPGSYVMPEFVRFLPTVLIPFP